MKRLMPTQQKTAVMKRTPLPLLCMGVDPSCFGVAVKPTAWANVWWVEGRQIQQQSLEESHKTICKSTSQVENCIMILNTPSLRCCHGLYHLLTLIASEIWPQKSRVCTEAQESHQTGSLLWGKINKKNPQRRSAKFLAGYKKHLEAIKLVKGVLTIRRLYFGCHSSNDSCLNSIL